MFHCRWRILKMLLSLNDVTVVETGLAVEAGYKSRDPARAGPLSLLLYAWGWLSRSLQGSGPRT